MRVLFVGSSRHITDAAERSPFEDACRALGRAFARSGIEVAVGSERPSTADRFIVEGAAEVGKKTLNKGSLPVVLVTRPESGGTPFDDFKDSIHFRYRRFQGSWESIRVPQVLDSDAVVVIGGSTNTLAAGQIALALHKPVISVPSFDGSAKELWPALYPYYQNIGTTSEEIGRLAENWQENNADLVVDATKELIKRRIFDPRPRLPMGIFLSALITCLIAWTILFAHSKATGDASLVYSYFSMLALAGFLGTILRTSMRLIQDPTAKFSWNQLLLELAAGLLLGFALALLYLVGAITINGNGKLLFEGSEAFQRVAVVMTLLGLGGGLALEQASDRVSGWFTEQFRSGSS